MRTAQLAFSAIVGQPVLRLALLLVVVDPTIGGVLVRGEPGTGKSTAVRALRSLLPPVEVVEGCEFGCDPVDHARLCDDCCARWARLGSLPTARRPVPLGTLPLGATEDRLLGTLDLTTALHDGRRRLLPGILAEVNRGFLYVDEVNLAADHLMDGLLDAASSGVHHVERDGISVSHPARFSLIGTMNPSEGGLRPQLLDRFALSVDAKPILDARLRAEVVARHLAVATSPAHRDRYEQLDRDLAARVGRARARLPEVTCPAAVLTEIAALTSALGVASHRADLVIARTAAAHAALSGRGEVTVSDVVLAAALALRHRTADADAVLDAVAARRPGGELRSVEQLLDDTDDSWLSQDPAVDPPAVDPPADDPPADGLGAAEDQGGSGTVLNGAGPGAARSTSSGAGAGAGARTGAEAGVRAGAVATSGATPTIARLEPWRAGPDGPVRLPGRLATELPLARLGTEAGALALRARGHAGGSLGPTGRALHGRVAVVPTISTAARRVLTEGRARPLPLRPEPVDLMRTSRLGRPTVALVIVLDASWSMAMDGTFTRARAVVHGVLDRMIRGDRTGLVVVGGPTAHVAVPFDRRTDAIADLVMSLRPRGRTHLLDGIDRALDLASDRWRYRGCATPAVVLVTDGRDNRADPAHDRRAQLGRLAARVQRRQVPGAILAFSGRTPFVRQVGDQLCWPVHDLDGICAP